MVRLLNCRWGCKSVLLFLEKGLMVMVLGLGMWILFVVLVGYLMLGVVVMVLWMFVWWVVGIGVLLICVYVLLSC